MSNERVAVVGAGISGLALAYHLKKQGKQVTVFESAAEAGGKIKTIHQDGFELDLGPVSCAATPALLQLIADLQLEEHVLPAQGAVSKRYIYSAGKIHAVEPSPPKLLMHPMLSWKGRFGLLKDVFIKPATESSEDESVAQFVRRHFGEEAHQKLFNPVLNGIYAGDSERLSISSTLGIVKTLSIKYGSVIKGLRAEKERMKSSRKIISMKGGFAALIRAMQNQLGEAVQLATQVMQITPGADTVTLKIQKSGSVEEQIFSKVHVTLPAFACASLFSDFDSGITSTLNQIPYNRVWQIYCEVDVADHAFDGFGFLIPAAEKTSLLGAICISNIFPDKAPQGKKLFALFCGGERPYAFEAKVEEAIKEFHGILKPAAIKALHVQEWSQAIPQFYVGHKRLLQSLKEFEAAHPNVAFAGNYVSGVSLGDCVEYSLKETVSYS